jgi:type I restriction enzyme, S subunit
MSLSIPESQLLELRMYCQIILFHHFGSLLLKKKYQELKHYTVYPDDIVVTTMGTIGRAAVVPNNVGTCIIDSHLFRMRVDKSKVFPTYLCYAINGYSELKA